MDKLLKQPGGIYFHVPFCVRKCPYCDFYSCTDLDRIPEYVAAVAAEIKMTPDADFCADSLYFGGGTPSLLPPKAIQQLIDAACSRFNVASAAEITMEANPGTVNSRNLAGFRRAGVNRINIGVQSFQDAALLFLSRIHSADDGVRAVEQAKAAGFDNMGLDLIYGLPGQSEALWESDLRAAVRLNPRHLSCYILTYEPGTRMTEDLRSGRFQALPDDQVARLYALTPRFLAKNGFLQYEVSNFAASFETRSRHNQKYWNHLPYFGFGPSAHSFTKNQRFWNARSLDDYLEKIRQGRLPTQAKEDLTPRQLMMETLYLRLRCVDGIMVSEFDKRFDVVFDQMFDVVIERYQADNLLERSGDYCGLTRKGMLFADAIASGFIDLI